MTEILSLPASAGERYLGLILPLGQADFLARRNLSSLVPFASRPACLLESAGVNQPTEEVSYLATTKASSVPAFIARKWKGFTKWLVCKNALIKIE